ncbi:MAG: polysaccharide deacetylase family protein [Flavisolibacter sp.]
MRKRLLSYFLFICFLFFHVYSNAQSDSTYAEKLGFPKGKKVVILHVDDVGMSLESNNGAIESMTQGVASSCSVMMPCSWVPGFIHYYKEHPGLDAGLHLTLTSEWKEYRWGPLSGKARVPGLTDTEGDLWPTVADVLNHATADEVETEIRSQIDRALVMGFHPSHLDSHMGTLFASKALMERYVKIGTEYKIPLMFPGGHNTIIKEQTKSTEEFMQAVRLVGKSLWNAGLPVLDDLHNESYDWKLPEGAKNDSASIQKLKTEYYKTVLSSLKPGITMVIMHCTKLSSLFNAISNSGITRWGDVLAMINPELKEYIVQQGIIITTWTELMKRRNDIK